MKNVNRFSKNLIQNDKREINNNNKILSHYTKLNEIFNDPGENNNN